MRHAELVAAADKIRGSSFYAAGDPLTFKVVFLRGEVELPAPSDPYAYLAVLKGHLGVQIPKGGRVAVVGSGFGGLCALALAEGAREVVAIEPRLRYRDGIDAVTALLDKMYAPDEDNTARTFIGWPTPENTASLGQFDMILWPECFEECVQPVATLTAVLKLLKSGQPLVMEIKTGENTNIPAGRINSWLPSQATFESLVAQIGAEIVTFEPGRAQNRTLYAMRATSPTLPKIPPAPSTLPPFPRDPTPKTVHQVGWKPPVTPPSVPVAPKAPVKAAPIVETKQEAPVTPETKPITEEMPGGNLTADPADEPIIILDDTAKPQQGKKKKPK